MSVWRIRGYVPDSDDEDDDILDILDLSRDLTSRVEAAEVDDRPAEAAVSATDHDGRVRTSFVPPPNEPTKRSTAEQLQASLQDCLDLVQSVRAIASPPDILGSHEDDSPLSSLPSSIANSPQQHRLADTDGDALLITSENAPQFAPRRNFRTRAPIQQHPYAIEDAKYRQLMKDRGLKPINAPSTTAHPQIEQITEESQETEDFQSSQAIESLDFDVASSPTNSLLVGNELTAQHALVTEHEVSGDDLDEGLPDLSQLVQQRSLLSRRTSKLSSKPFGQLLGRPAPVAITSRLNTANGKSLSRHSASAQHVLIVPPSPPHSDNLAMIDDEEEDIVSTFRRTKRPDTPNALPTPLASSEPGSRKRPVTELSSEESSQSSDEEQLSSQAQADEDDSQVFKRVSKKWRGVLPPSFLRLDLQEQIRTKTLPQHVQPPIVQEQGRGVARRTTIKGSRSSRYISNDVFRLSDSEAESETEPDVENGRRQDSRVQTSLPGSGSSMMVDVVDDNVMMDYNPKEDEIDHMLPSISRRRSAPKSRGSGQGRIDDGWAIKSHRSAADAVAVGLIGKQALNSRMRPRTKNRAKRRKIRHRRQPSEMNVCDAPDIRNLEKKAQPQFLRVAARQAKRTNHQQVQSPSRKVFVFATKDETQEVNNQIKSWKARRGGGVTRPVAGANVNKTTTTHAAGHVGQSAHPTFNTSTEKSARGAHSSALTDLKLSSNALLSRISARNVEPSDRTAIVGASTASGRVPNEQPRTDTEYLRSLFTHRNRSGQGHLLAKLPESRPAQVESNRQSFVQRTKIPIRTIRTIPVRSKKSSVQPVLQTSSAVQQDKANYQIIRRKLKKQIPKRSTVTMESTDPLSSFGIATDEPRLGIQQGQTIEPQVPADGSDKWTINAVCAIHDLNLLAKGAIFSSSSLLGTRVLEDIRECYQNAWYDPVQPKHSTITIKTPNSLQTMSCGLYNNSVSRFIMSTLEEVHRSFFEPDKEQGYVLEEQERCVQSIKSVVDYVINAAFFEDTDDTNAVDNLADLSQELARYMSDFLQNYREKLQPNGGKKTYILDCLNGFALLAFHLHTVLNKVNMPLHVQLREVTTSILILILETILEPRSLISSLDRLQSLCSDYPSHIIDINTPFPEAESLVVTWHLSLMLSVDTSTKQFFDQVTAALPHEKVSDWSSHLAIDLMALCFILPFTQVTSRGETFTDPRDFILPDPSCFEILVNRLQDLVKEVLPGRAHPLVRILLEAVEDICLKMAKTWCWYPDPSLVSALYRTYTWNAMLPFNTFPNQGISFSDLECLFDGTDYKADNDFYKFLELVKLCISGVCRLNSDFDNEDQLTAPGKLRAFIFSLIPNNAQNCDARESLQETQVLALKNHFSLYVTLFICAPEGSKPRFTQLEQQVDFSTSHKVVCELALTAWKTISVYHVQQADPNHGNLSDVSRWMNTMLRQSIACFEHGNKVQAISVLEQLLSSLATVVTRCHFEVKARALLQGDLFETVSMLLGRSELHYHSDQVVVASLRVIDAYMQTTSTTPLSQTLITEAQLVVKGMIKQTLSSTSIKNHDTLRQLIETWFSTAKNLVNQKHKSWDDFMEPRSDLSLDLLSGFREDYVTHQAKQIFYGELIKAEPDAYSLDYRPLVFKTWIPTLLLPDKQMYFEHHLTECILRHERESLKIKNLAKRLLHHVGEKDFTLQCVADSRLVIIRHIIQNIYEQQHDPEEEWLAGGLDSITRKQLLRTMLTTMKTNWIGLKADPIAQHDYTVVVHAILNELETHPVTDVNIDQWFYDADEFSRPRQTLDNIFKCRFGESAGDITNEAISSFRSYYLQNVGRNRFQDLVQDLFRVFHCTDSLRSRTRDGSTQYSIDIEKQTKFVQIVFPVYIELGSLTLECTVFDPMIELLIETAKCIHFRIDNLNPANMKSFWIATTTILCAVRKAIERNQLEHHSTPLLLRYVRTVTVTMFSLAEYGIDIDETVHEMAIFNILGIYYTVFRQLDAEEPKVPENGVDYNFPDANDKGIDHGVVDTKDTAYGAWINDVPGEDFDLVPGVVPMPAGDLGDRLMNMGLYADAEEPELTEQEEYLRAFAWRDLRGREKPLGRRGWRWSEVRKEMVALVEVLKGRELVGDWGEE